MTALATDPVDQALRAAMELRHRRRHGDALERLAGQPDNNPKIALARAQLAYESWRPATAAWRAALRLMPGDLRVVRGLAGSLAADGDAAAADAQLAQALAATPAWLDGQATLADLRATHGDTAPDRDFATAITSDRASTDPAPWLAWFQWLAKARRWDQAGIVLDRADAALGGSRALALSRLLWAAESGHSRDPALFDAVADIADPGLDIARIRHALRLGRADAVDSIAARHLDTPAGQMFWPYVALGWRAAGDGRAALFDRAERAIRRHELGIDPAALTALADFLRPLHRAIAPQVGQSVRGGTQTERSLLLHHSPVIADLAARIERAIADHVADLPPIEPRHPWLAAPRSSWRLSGSWSVRLAGGGHHAPHTHPAGWLSSALHIVLPDVGQGTLQFGAPPPELGLDLQWYAQVTPAPGTLVLFPSVLWHSTTTAGAGERLTVAFDVASG